MSLRLRAFLFALVASALVAAPACRAQGAPAGYIWDVNTVDPGPITAYTQYTTHFTADAASEYVSFAFRESPAFWAFSNPTVTQQGFTANLLTDPLFQGSTDGQNCNHNNSLGCPPGWGAWIQPIDVTAIGQVNTNTDTGGCDVGAQTGTNFWCDGSVEGYDAIFQQLTGLTAGQVYNISFYLEDDSGASTNSATSADCTVSGGSCVDALVYAGDQLPVGTVNLAASPEPSSLLLLGTGLTGLVSTLRRRRRNLAA